MTPKKVLMAFAATFFLWAWLIVNFMSFSFRQATHPYVHLLALAGLALLQVIFSNDD